MSSEPAQSRPEDQTGNFRGVRTDDEQTLEAAREILRKYEEVLRYEDVLTYGLRRHRPKLETRISGSKNEGRPGRQRT